MWYMRFDITTLVYINLLKLHDIVLKDFFVVGVSIALNWNVVNTEWLTFRRPRESHFQSLRELYHVHVSGY